jgi:hypothetical protein
MSGLKILTLEELKKVSLNYENFRNTYIAFLTDKTIQKNITTIEISKDFDINLFKKDLQKVFSLNEEEYLEIDLENYFEASSISSLIGASKGYIGYDSGGILSEHIIKHPFSLIYFKNLDKAHVTIQSFVKKIINEAYFIDNKSRKVYLYNTIILYSNRNKKEKVIGITPKK